MKPLYTAQATAEGGRDGKVSTSDNTLQENLTVPKDMGGSGGEGTNPEQLFASGYAACFDGALNLIASKAGEEIESKTTVDVHIGKEGDGFGLAADINVEMKGVDQDKADELVQKANDFCPYSKATKGNIEVSVNAKAV